LRLNLLAIFVFCSLSFIPSAALTQTSEGTQKMPPPLGKLVDVGGYRVHLFCVGTGSPTVVIVGAGFSFDWDLVQSEVAKFSQICSYDHSGIAWSDDGPKDSCALRVNEVHSALKNSGINGPYVVVGHSLGALVARLYAGHYPDEVAGIVFVDHALLMKGNMIMPPPGAVLLPPPSGAAKNEPPVGLKALGLEDDPNFSKLPAADREAHLWFMAQPRNQNVLQNNAELMPVCFEDADAIVKGHSQPLGDKPVVNIDTPMTAGAEVQSKLLALSRNSKEMTAEGSGHFVIIDRPDIVVDAIRQAVLSARSKKPL
jgi:pimeloyl-ACP methyl ester carboxylesterase